MDALKLALYVLLDFGDTETPHIGDEETMDRLVSLAQTSFKLDFLNSQIHKVCINCSEKKPTWNSVCW